MVHCPEDDSQCKEIPLFKDIGNHLTSHSFQSLKPQANKCTINFIVKLWSRSFFKPMEFESTDGMTFYMYGNFDQDNFAIFWLYFLGSPQEVKNYAYTLSITTKIGDKFTYYGHVKPLDEASDKIIAEESGFAIRPKVIEKALDEENWFQIEVTIHALKEDAKDTDMESGLSTDESD